MSRILGASFVQIPERICNCTGSQRIFQRGFLMGASADNDKIAGRICAQPPHSLRLTKSLLRQGQSATYDAALEDAATAQVMSHATADYREGVSALIEKRAPRFKAE